MNTYQSTTMNIFTLKINHKQLTVTNCIILFFFFGFVFSSCTSKNQKESEKGIDCTTNQYAVTIKKIVYKNIVDHLDLDTVFIIKDKYPRFDTLPAFSDKVYGMIGELPISIDTSLKNTTFIDNSNVSNCLAEMVIDKIVFKSISLSELKTKKELGRFNRYCYFSDIVMFKKENILGIYFIFFNKTWNEADFYLINMRDSEIFYKLNLDNY